MSTSENLLQELDSKLQPDGDGAAMAALEAWKQSLDTAGRAYAEQVGAGVRGLLGTAAQFKEIWALSCRHVAAGHTEEVHSTRARFLRAFEERLAHLRSAHDLVCFASRMVGRDMPVAGALRGEIEALAPMLQRLASRWQTSEDLEDLVAESMAPAPEKLEAVARKYGGPSEWHRGEAEHS